MYKWKQKQCKFTQDHCTGAEEEAHHEAAESSRQFLLMMNLCAWPNFHNVSQDLLSVIFNS